MQSAFGPNQLKPEESDLQSPSERDGTVLSHPASKPSRHEMTFFFTLNSTLHKVHWHRRGQLLWHRSPRCLSDPPSGGRNRSGSQDGEAFSFLFLFDVDGGVLWQG